MRTHLLRSRYALVVLVLLLSAATPAANDPKILTLDEYGRWSRIVSTAISADGAWVTYGYRPNGGDDTLHVKNVSSGKVHTIPNGAEPKFADDSAWVGYVVNLPKKEADKLRKAKKPVTKAVELMNLASGETFKVENASSFSFPDGSRVVAIKRDKSDREAKHEGVDLIVRTLANGATQNIGNVADYAFNKAGSRLAYTIDAAGELHKSTGTVQQGITEIGQVRMGVGYFDNPTLYHSQSPLHHAQKIRTPFLILHGTEDGAVDWHQGLEFYNAAKRWARRSSFFRIRAKPTILGRKRIRRTSRCG